MDIKLCGVVNVTEVDNPEDSDQDAVIYAFRLSIENGTGADYYMGRLILALKWKYHLAVNDGGSIFQDFFGEVDSAEVTITMSTNLPDGIVQNLLWTGDGDPWEVPVPEELILNSPDTYLHIPPGKWVVEVFAQVLKSAIEDLIGEDCPLPALFPSIVQLNARNPKSNLFSYTASALIGCAPEVITVNDVV